MESGSILHKLFLGKYDRLMSWIVGLFLTTPILLTGILLNGPLLAFLYFYDKKHVKRRPDTD